MDAAGREYWLAHCEGYRVDRGGRRLGFVQRVRCTGDGEAASALVVRTGRLGGHVEFVPLADVAFVVPRALRIWLRAPGAAEPAPIAPRPFVRRARPPARAPRRATRHTRRVVSRAR